jgi:uncharacterized protein YndB with AHSA1/START domain
MDKIILCPVKLQCEVQQAFKMFTSKRLLEGWLTSVAEVEPVVGGKYELFWDPDNRENNSTLGCKVTAIEADRLLAFEWKSPKQFKGFANCADPLTHVVVFFVPEGTNTWVYLLHSGWRQTPEWEEARLWQERAWRSAFDELEKHIDRSFSGPTPI